MTTQRLEKKTNFYKSKVEDLENRVKELSTEHAYIQKENEDFRLKLKQANSRPFNRFKKSFRRH